MAVGVASAAAIVTRDAAEVPVVGLETTAVFTSRRWGRTRSHLGNRVAMSQPFTQTTHARGATYRCDQVGHVQADFRAMVT